MFTEYSRLNSASVAGAAASVFGVQKFGDAQFFYNCGEWVVHVSGSLGIGCGHVIYFLIVITCS